MGNRITRAATHLPQEAVQQRMQAERRRLQSPTLADHLSSPDGSS